MCLLKASLNCSAHHLALPVTWQCIILKSGCTPTGGLAMGSRQKKHKADRRRRRDKRSARNALAQMIAQKIADWQGQPVPVSEVEVTTSLR